MLHLISDLTNDFLFIETDANLFIEFAKIRGAKIIIKPQYNKYNKNSRKRFVTKKISLSKMKLKAERIPWLELSIDYRKYDWWCFDKEMQIYLFMTSDLFLYDLFFTL